MALWDAGRAAGAGMGNRRGGRVRRRQLSHVVLLPFAAAAMCCLHSRYSGTTVSAFLTPGTPPGHDAGRLAPRARARTCSVGVRQRVAVARPHRAEVLARAKKKKGPSGLVDLDALEAAEAMLGEEPVVAPVSKKALKGAAKKEAKANGAPQGGVKGARAAALAAIEALDLDDEGELMGPGGIAPQEPVLAAEEKIAVEANPMPGAAIGDGDGDEGDDREVVAAVGSGPKGARAAALAALDALDSFADEPDLDDVLGGKKKKKKDKKAKKGKKDKGDIDDEEQSPVAEDPDHNTLIAPDPEEADKEEEDDSLTDEAAETLEQKMRKSRPPPRVRISETSQPGFVNMRLEGVAVTFKNQEVLTDASWEVKTGERVGLVGPNGGGKTTQMRILAGEIEPTTGEVTKSSKDLRIAFLKQEFVDELDFGRSLKDEFRSVFKEEADIVSQLRLAEEKLADPAVQADEDAMQAVLNEMGDLQETAERMKVYGLDSKIEKVMDTMGFSPSEGDALVSSFSGGWRMRIGLGKILLQDPNILLLDEPTNHLDLESVEWLEEFLQTQSLPMVIVSHDREFLDRVCNKIVDTEFGFTTTYDGNYSRFLKLKKARYETWESAYEAQQKKVREEKAWINKFKNKGSFGPQIKSREKAIEKMTTGPDAVKKPPHPGKPFVFRFPPAPRASMEMISVEGVSHGYPGNPLMDHVNLLVETGQRIAFLGPNGAGKSTLLRLIVGEEEPASGEARLGPGVVLNVFRQNQADSLDMDKTVLQTLEDASSEHSYNELRKLLGQFMFKGDTVHKKIGQLSGGEKARVALCTFMLRPANLLVLDEPTNHLDVGAKEILEEALQHYDGAVVVVSHDRYFISQVANTICAIEDRELKRYEGDYKYYLDNSNELLDKVEARYVEGVQGIQSAKTVDLEEVVVEKKKKNFGGKGGPSGRSDKGIKNAKRMN
jgi:ATP-binding cassette subfamily F protein 3